MKLQDIELNTIPKLENGILIACFEGWGNALEVSRGMGHFLIRKLEARLFGTLETDPFYLFREHRPVVSIEEGILKKLDFPGCNLHVAPKERVGRDIIILSGDEPDLQWLRFTHNILSLCIEAGVKTIISCGGMLDNILHTDRMISVVASSKELVGTLPDQVASLITYMGQSSIHSTIHFEAKKQGLDCVGLYCHCPYYIQGITHFGLLAYLGNFLSEWAGFDLNTDELDLAWKESSKQIEEAIKNNPELKQVINELRKTRTRGTLGRASKNDKVIKLEDYFRI
jgi:proteasome assembly chaperone (PAC2) family protein